MKGQGLSINILIIAIVGLLVMVVVISFFSTNIGEADQGFNDCRTAGGVCLDKTMLEIEKQRNPATYSPFLLKECSGVDQRCYIITNKGGVEAGPGPKGTEAPGRIDPSIFSIA